MYISFLNNSRNILNSDFFLVIHFSLFLTTKNINEFLLFYILYIYPLKDVNDINLMCSLHISKLCSIIAKRYELRPAYVSYTVTYIYNKERIHRHYNQI